jgi:hypothetical protein
VPDPGELSQHPAVTVAVGAAATAFDGAAAVIRGVERLPVVGGWLRRGCADLAVRGEQVIAALAVPLVEIVLDELDLDDLVRKRVDLVGLANDIVDGIDLPAIIRQSTDSVTAEVLTDVRSQGERADELVSGFVDRLLGRAREPV